MGLLDFLLSDSNNDRKKEIDNKLFEDECKVFGLDKNEAQECKNIGITPEEYARENFEDYEDD